MNNKRIFYLRGKPCCTKGTRYELGEKPLSSRERSKSKLRGTKFVKTTLGSVKEFERRKTLTIHEM